LFDQGGLGLPDESRYTSPDNNSVQIRQEYKQHMANMFALIGDVSPIHSA